MLFAIRPDLRRDLSLRLAGFRRGSPFAAAPSVHMARLAIIDAAPARCQPPPATVPLNPARLLFGASVDGGLRVLVDELLPERASALDDVFTCCAGSPGLTDASVFLDWLEEHRLPAAISFATVAATAARTRRALRRQQRLSSLVARAVALTPAELRREFDRVVGE